MSIMFENIAPEITPSKRIVITKDSMTGVIEEIAYSGGKISSIKIGLFLSQINRQNHL